MHEKIARTADALREPRARAALDELAVLVQHLSEGDEGENGSLDTIRRMRELVMVLEEARSPTRAGADYARAAVPARGALDDLRMPVQYVKGVGPKRAEQLAKFGITTIEDMLFHLPFRYEDRRHVRTIADLRPGETATVEAVLGGVRERWGGRGRRKVLEAMARDETGCLVLAWYHQLPYVRARLREGARILLHGRVDVPRTFTRRNAASRPPAGRGSDGSLRMIHPEMEDLENEERPEVGRIVPIYSKPTEMAVGAIRRLVHGAVDLYAGGVPSVLPAAITQRRALCDLAMALRLVHHPGPDADVDALNAASSPGHRAIVYDELFYLQLGMALRRGAIAREPGIAFHLPAARAERLRAALPFALTGAQHRVLAEIERDMARPHPMHRLIQGDVGSGKTVVALHAAAVAIDNGYQAALMAPTELLAEQHCATIRRLAAPVDLRVALLAGSVQGKLRGRSERAIARGDVDLVIGTHALIQDGIEFCRLGLGIIDEQHRFGVVQRARLKRHGAAPDILLMTATPIPRTLALTLYGDLDVSLLDELPPGRRPIVTRVYPQKQRDRVLAAVRAELDAGRQAYVVCPLVVGSEKIDLLDATRVARELAAGPLAGYRLGLVHGQMPSDEKDAVMRRFRDGEYQVLVSTTVIEVGIDVPNATVMIIEHAERFGLAQLHQLRGRVGRGTHRSLCFLLAAYARGDDARARLAIMEETNDGFRIAERDLALRGPGELLGTRQAGLPDFRATSLVRDEALVRAAHEDATAWLADDPELAAPESAGVREVLAARWAGRLELARVG